MGKVMDQFEMDTEKLDIQTSVIDSSISAGTATVMPQNDIDKLMNQVASDHHLENELDALKAPSAPSALPTVSTPTATPAATDDALNDRLAALRNGPVM